jgi:hypothetical protein
MPRRARPIATEAQCDQIEAGDWHRASGQCVCDVCGKLYYDHPYFAEPYEFLTILCNGDIVKL